MLISPRLGMTSSTLLITNLMVKRSTARMENTLGHFHKNTESPAVATVLCAHLLLHLNGELIHFQQFVVEAFLKKISSVCQLSCKVSSSDLDFFFLLLL